MLITGDREIAALNARFRKKKKPTDVLSFPPLARGDGFLGDIAISAENAARNAQALKHSTADEIRILILHGVLHLAGYDHESDSGEMAQIEHQLRRRMGLPVSLIERNSRERRSTTMLRPRRAERAKSPVTRARV